MTAAEGPSVDRQVERAVAFILRSTRSRPQTEAELADKLRERELGDEVSRAALSRAHELGAVDDSAFARAWVHDRGHGRGYGLARLRQELIRRQVPEHVAAAALAELEDRDEEAVATDLAKERFARFPPALDPEKAARRLVGFLQRRGYGPRLAQRVAMDVTGLSRAWD